MNKFGEKLSANTLITVHSLIAGFAYFILVMRFIVDYTSVSSSALLLGIFFCPAVICGSAALLIKKMRIWRDLDNCRAIGILAVVNIVILLISAVLGTDMIINLF